MTKNILIILILFLNVHFASGGSVYSRFGLGDMKLSHNGRGFAMGESGIALAEREYIGAFNPAGWNNIQLVIFETGLTFSGYDISSSDNSNFYSETDFSGFTIAFPVSASNGISLVAGLLPYSNVQFEIIDEVSSDVTGNYTVDYSGTGGLSKAFMGLSYTLPFDLSLGASFEYLTGIVNNDYELEFSTDSDFNNSSYELDMKNHGVGFTLGLISPDILPLIGADNLGAFRIGLTYHNVPNLKSDSVLISNTQAGETELKNTSFDTKIPARYGAGMSFMWNENYTVVLDYLYQPFSKYEQKGLKNENLRDLQRISAGFEFRHETSRFSSAWEQMRWRAGISYEQTQYLINGKGIDEFAIYAGFSFPLAYENSVDIGFKYGIRGTADNNLLKETLFESYISISLGDIWFMRPER